MRLVPRCGLTVGLLLTLLTGGCALRATTDFGPGDEPHRRSAGAGVGPFPDVFNSDARPQPGDEAAIPKSGDEEALDDGRHP